MSCWRDANTSWRARRVARAEVQRDATEAAWLSEVTARARCASELEVRRCSEALRVHMASQEDARESVSLLSDASASSGSSDASMCNGSSLSHASPSDVKGSSTRILVATDLASSLNLSSAPPSRIAADAGRRRWWHLAPAQFPPDARGVTASEILQQRVYAEDAPYERSPLPFAASEHWSSGSPKTL